MTFGIYIHWPFCLSKCPYCDFYKEVRKDIDQEGIISGYIKELDFYLNLTKDKTVGSVFFGGGTPSLIEPRYIQKILDHIAKNWNVSSDAEISLEANPNSHYPQMFKSLKSAGINRLSLGVQALNEKDLKFLGRSHNLAQAEKAIDEVLSTFDNHSIDLIYARPQQEIGEWQKELTKATGLGFAHMSLYQLTIEEGTIFAKKGIEPLDEEKAVEQYLLTEDLLKQFGYLKYEVSNYAKKGFESKHNLLYWQGDDYLGIGQSAHGRLTNNNTFFATTHSCQMEELSIKERAQELVIMGMRLSSGIDKNRFREIIGEEFESFINRPHLEALQKEGLIVDTQNSIKPTKEGFLLLNKIIEDLCI